VHGVPTTVPERSIVDSLQAGTQPEQVALAVHQAPEPGLTTPRRLRAAAAGRSDRVRGFVEREPERVSAVVGVVDGDLVPGVDVADGRELDRVRVEDLEVARAGCGGVVVEASVAERDGRSPAYPQAVVAFDLGESVGKDTPPCALC